MTDEPTNTYEQQADGFRGGYWNDDNEWVDDATWDDSEDWVDV